MPVGSGRAPEPHWRRSRCLCEYGTHDVPALADWRHRRGDHGRACHGGAGTRNRQSLPGAAILVVAGTRVRPAERPDGVDRLSRPLEARIPRRRPTAPALARDRRRRRVRFLAPRDGRGSRFGGGLRRVASARRRLPPRRRPPRGDLRAGGIPACRDPVRPGESRPVLLDTLRRRAGDPGRHRRDRMAGKTRSNDCFVIDRVHDGGNLQRGRVVRQSPTHPDPVLDLRKQPRDHKRSHRYHIQRRRGRPLLVVWLPPHDPAVGAHGDPSHLHGRFDRRGRGRPDAPAGGAPGLAARHPRACHDPAGRCQRGGRGVPGRDADASSAGGAGALTPAAADPGSDEVRVGVRRRARRVRARRGLGGKARGHPDRVEGPATPAPLPPPGPTDRSSKLPRRWHRDVRRLLAFRRRSIANARGRESPLGSDTATLWHGGCPQQRASVAKRGGMMTPERSPLSTEELRKMNAYWRAANYLSVGQSYLFDNPLLKEPLERAHIKPRLLGHWGTQPGLDLLYVHLNRIIKKHDLNMICVIGPGHGGPGLVANAYLEGTYSEVYPAIGQDVDGMKKLFNQFSFPGGIPSHVAPETPGSIHEGGELGYALSHAHGAAFDKIGRASCRESGCSTVVAGA